MKILFIDYLSNNGHKTFNTIQLKALLSLGIEIDYVGKKGYFENANNSYYYELPNILFNKSLTKYVRPLTSRILDVFKILYINYKCKLNDYDYVVFSSYDIMSIVFFRTKKLVLIFNHNNVAGLTNRIKLFLTKRLPSNFVHLALNSQINEVLRTLLSIDRVFTISHGLLQPFNVHVSKNDICRYSRIIFCLASSSCDILLMNLIFSDISVRDFLKKNNLKVLIKSASQYKFNVPKSENIKFVESYISQIEYMALIHNSLFVFLPYDKSFRWRVSGVFFECLANNTPVITSGIDAFITYEKFLNYKFKVSSPTEFIERCESIRHLKFKSNSNLYENLNELNPTKFWKNLFNNKFVSDFDSSHIQFIHQKNL